MLGSQRDLKVTTSLPFSISLGGGVKKELEVTAHLTSLWCVCMGRFAPRPGNSLCQALGYPVMEKQPTEDSPIYKLRHLFEHWKEASLAATQAEGQHVNTQDKSCGT